MDDITKLLVFTDLHLLGEGETIIGLDPSARFAEGLAHALAQHPDAARLVLMGDLTHHGRTIQYAELERLLQGVPLPITYMLGNHDNRRVFHTRFPQAEVTAQGHVQQMVDIGSACLITLDTLDPESEPHHAGLLCADQLEWLERALAWADGRNVVVAMHHPPVMTGFPGMDRIALQQPEILQAILGGYKGMLHVICGHVHRTISGRSRGLSFTCFKSPCHQQPMTLGAAETDHSVDEPGAYGILLCSPDGIIAHTEDFGPAAAATPLRDPSSR